MATCVQVDQAPGSGFASEARTTRKNPRLNGVKGARMRSLKGALRLEGSSRLGTKVEELDQKVRRKSPREDEVE